MAARALLDRNPSPSREEIAEAIAGNVCRCTGYQSIIDRCIGGETSRSIAGPDDRDAPA